MGSSIAAVAGVPLMAAVAGACGWRAAFATIGAVLLVATLAVRLWFPATAPRPGGMSARGTLGTLWRVRGLPSVLGANLPIRSRALSPRAFVGPVTVCWLPRRPL